MELDTALDLFARDTAAPLDVAEVALRLARDEYPDLDVDAYLSELDSMAREARPYLRGSLDSRVRGLCRYLFHEMGFRGNARHYYDARNSYLNEVLDRRKGIPITLSVVATAVGRRAGLEIVGVGLPGHFIAKALGDDEEVLFDPFHGGRLLSADECERLVEQVTGEPFTADARALRACPPGLIVLRMLNNLKGVYLRAGDFTRAVRVIHRLRQIAPGDTAQLRDLGASLLQSGKAGPAINPLESYLERLPEAGDAADVRRLLDRARGEVAKWN